jgi:hypothetical protein
MILGPDGKTVKKGDHQVSEVNELLNSIEKNIHECMPEDRATLLTRVIKLEMSINTIERFMSEYLMRPEQAYNYNKIFVEQVREMARTISSESVQAREEYRKFLYQQQNLQHQMEEALKKSQRCEKESKYD